MWEYEEYGDVSVNDWASGGGMAEGRRPLFLLETFLYIDEKKWQNTK